MPSRPPTGDSGDPRPRLRSELDAVVALVRRVVGGDHVFVVVRPEVLRVLTEDESLALSAEATIVGAGPLADALRAPGGCVAADRVLLASGAGVGLVVAPPREGLDPDALVLATSLAAVAVAAVSTVVDLVTAHARIRELDELSSMDSLTGLRNRRHLDRVLPYEIVRRRRYERALTVMMLDLDRFKRINDEHGHEGGDAVLCGVAEVLSGSLRGADVAIRYGGEEFAAVLPETAAEGAAQVAERIRSRTEALVVRGIRVTTSIGVASVEGRWDGDAAALIRAADQALYVAKREGRNRVVHTNLAEGSIDSSPRIQVRRLP